MRTIISVQKDGERVC